MENKTPIQELIDHFDREVKLGFLSQDNVDRIEWYLKKYWLEKELKYCEQQYNKAVLDCIENAKIKSISIPIKNKIEVIPNSKTTQIKFIIDEESIIKLIK